MRPNGNFDLTWEDVQAEIESLPKAGSGRTALDAMTESQKQILVKGRESGCQWKGFQDWWRKQGWPGGSEGTLLKCYRILKEQGY